MNHKYGLLIHEGGSIEVVRLPDGMTQGRWIRKLLDGARYGGVAESNAPGGVLLFCPGAGDSAPVNKGATTILREKETVSGAALYLPGKCGTEYKLYTQERAEMEKRILGVLIR